MCYTQPDLSPSPRTLTLKICPHPQTPSVSSLNIYLIHETRQLLNKMDSLEILSRISHVSFVYFSLHFTQDLEVRRAFPCYFQTRKIELIRKEHAHLLTFTTSALACIIYILLCAGNPPTINKKPSVPEYSKT